MAFWISPFIIEPLFEVETDVPPAVYPYHQLVVQADNNSEKLAQLIQFIEQLDKPNQMYQLAPEFSQISPRNRTAGRIYSLKSRTITVVRYHIDLEPAQRILLKLELGI